MKLILFYIILFLFCFAMSVKAAENLNIKEVETNYNGSIIEISASKKMNSVLLYKKNKNGEYMLFYKDPIVGQSNKQYFISQYRLSSQDVSELKAIALLEDGSKVSSEIDIEKIPIKPEPTTSVAPSARPPESQTPEPSLSQSPEPSQSQSPVPSQTPESGGKIILNKTSARLALNDNKTVQLKASLKNARSGTKIMWSTTNNSVATVNKSGLVTAVGTGETKITVKTASGQEASCNITVTASMGRLEVLFVGNSKTYVSNIPAKFKGLATNGGYKVNISTATKGGKTLKYLTTKSNNSKDKLTGKNNYQTITGKAYDYVIMQEQSDTYAKNYDTFLSGAKSLKNLVRKNNKNVKLFVRQCWVYKSSSTSSRNKGYSNAERVAREIGAFLVYDGKAIYKAKSSTKINMFVDDVHQSSAGAYLAASAIYSAIFDKSPVNLNYVADLKSSNAKILRQIAWNIYSSNK